MKMAVMSSDRDLVSLVAEGRQEALRGLYERNAGWLTVRLSRRCDDPGAVDEAVQDTFLAVWEQAGRYDEDRGCVGAWIWAIGVRKLIDVLRRRRPTAAFVSPAVPFTGGGRSAEDEVLEGVRWGDLGAALDRLSPELLAVLQARVLDGLTTAEAAELLDIPVGTVKTRLMRARRVLREVMA
jgi:RNA polymerase sigma-70 factor (ECF subfamily)